MKYFTIKNKVASAVLAIGVLSALGAVLMSVSQIIINSQMAEYGDMAIAAMGVAMKVVTILFTNQIVSAFLADTSAFGYAVQFSRILLTTSFLFGVFYVLTNALQPVADIVSLVLAYVLYVNTSKKMAVQ